MTYSCARKTQFLMQIGEGKVEPYIFAATLYCLVLHHFKKLFFCMKNNVEIQFSFEHASNISYDIE